MNTHPRRYGVAVHLWGWMLLTACSAPLSGLNPGVDVDALEAEVAHTPPGTGAYLEAAWLCLLHGRQCARSRMPIRAASEHAEDHALDLQVGLAEALLADADAAVAPRLAAWLRLAETAVSRLPADGDVADRLLTVAAEAVAHLYHRDPAAVVAGLAARSETVARWLQLGSAAERWRRGQALRVLPGPVLTPEVAAQWLPYQTTMEPTPRSRRLLTGLAALTGPFASADALPLPPLATTTPDSLQTFALPAREPGVYLLEVAFAVEGAERVLVQLTSSRPVRVLLDQQPVAIVLPHHSGHDDGPWLDLSAGPHTLHLLIPVGQNGQPLSLGLVRGPPRLPSPPVPWHPTLTDLVEVQRDPDSAAADRLESSFPQEVAHDVAHLRQSDLRDSAQLPAAAVLDALLQRWPTHADAQLARVVQLREGGQPQLAMQALDSLFPADPAPVDAAPTILASVQRADVRLERARLWLALGLADVAVSEAEHAAREHAPDCLTWRHALSLTEDALDRSAARRLLGTGRCREEALPVAFAEAMVGHLPEALALALDARRQAHQAREAAALARLLADALHQPQPQGSSPWQADPDQDAWRQAQDAAVGKDPAVAQSALQRILTAPGLALESRQRALRAGAVPLWQPFVRDGEALAQEEVAESLTGGAATVWLLDQEIVQLLPDGGALRRVHQVVRVLEDAAAEAVGEVRVADGADLELARTILQDGSVLLPAETGDKETISLRGVSAGTTVEFAQVAYVRPSDPATGTTRLPLFEMQSTSAPVLHSEYIVLAPTGMPVLLDASAAAGKPEVRQLGALTAHIFHRDQVPRIRNEPRAARPDQVLPTVQTVAKPQWAAVLGPWSEVLAAYVQSQDPALRTWRTTLQRLAPGLPRWQQLAARLALTVQHQHEGGPPGRPETALASGKGDRAATFYTLARQLGADACLVRVLPLARERVVPPEVPDPEDFGLELVRLRAVLPGGLTTDTWYDPGLEGGLLNHLRPGLRGRQGLAIGCPVDPADPRVTLPELGEGADLRTIDLTLTWGEDGALSGVVHERLSGALAHAVRSFLRGHGATTAALVEQLAGSVFGGARFALLDVSGLAAEAGRDGPIDLAYQVTMAADPGRQDALELDLWSDGLGPAYATLPSRVTSLLFSHATDLEVTIHVQGAVDAELPDPVEVQQPGLRYSRHVTRKGSTVLLTRSLHARPSVVSPSAYPDFAKALRAVDAADHVRLRRSP